jgi:hypothetical protein
LANSAAYAFERSYAEEQVEHRADKIIELYNRGGELSNIKIEDE